MDYIYNKVFKLDQDVRLWDISHIGQEKGLPITQQQQETWAKELMLNYEPEIRDYFHQDDFLIFALADTSDEMFLLGHPCRPHLKEFLSSFKPLCTQQIDIGPLEIVYEKLKEGQDQGKYKATLNPSADPHPDTVG